MQIKINNPTKACREMTGLSDRVNKGGATLTVLNTTGFTAHDYIVLRKLGDEQAELLELSSISASGLNLVSPTTRSHPIGGEIYIIPYNQVEISYKTSEHGTWSVLTTIALQPDKLRTIYEYEQGQTTDFFRVRFFNSYSGQYSSYSAEIKGEGASTSQSGEMVDIVLRRTNDKSGDYSLRTEIMQDLNLAYQFMYNALNQASSEFYRRDLEIATEDYKHEYTLPRDFKEILRIQNGMGVATSTSFGDDRYGIRGYQLVGNRTLYLGDVPQPEGEPTVTTILSNNAYNESGTWVGGFDTVNVTTDTSEYKTGSGSINFDADVSQSATNAVALTNDGFTSVDISDYDETGKFRMWVYLPDVTYISAVELYIGSSSSNYWFMSTTRDYKNHAFHDGWNLIEYDWADEDVEETGSPNDAAIDYAQVRITYSANQPDEEDFRLGAIMIASTWAHNYVYQITYLRQPTPVRNEMDEFDIPEGYQYLLIDYAVGQVLLRQDPASAKGNSLIKRFEDTLSKFISQSAKRTRRVIGFSIDQRRTYNWHGSDSTRITHSDGSVTPI